MTEEAQAITPEPTLSDKLNAVAEETEGLPREVVAGDSNQPPQLPDSDTLAKSMQSVMDRDRSLKQRDEQTNQLKALEGDYNQLLWLADNNPAEFLRRRGHTIDQLQAIDDGQSNVVTDLVQQVETLRHTIEKNDIDRARDRESQQNAAFDDSVIAWVDSSKSFFPVISAGKAGHLVAQKMREHFEATGQVMSESKAASEIERDLKNFVTQVAEAAGFVPRSDVKPSVISDRTVSGELAGSTQVDVELDDISDPRKKMQLLIEKHNI